ncbi:unnamed protein product [Acanthoscelides obtectus]|uniref:J domain-containing protein n=1 Tax=Acanthoscelides obtectus TaxID=200917 RepID=A0A9P0P282_ACAOB|nr:unnamed protein product [Acanthoscelides obtectus]CAK1643719.1 DnaJ homolog subfamily C member 24 [Acanthoscelides obtectus]
MTSNNPEEGSSSIKGDENYYEILGCNEGATLDELKQNYQQLVKKHHPDKQGDATSTEKFVKIDKAFKTLRDEKSRKEYDASLLQDDFSGSLIYAELKKNELDFVDDEAVFVCRCGEKISIPKDVLSEEESIIECSECTNCILVK